MIFVTNSNNDLIVRAVSESNRIKFELMKHLSLNKKDFLSSNIDSIKLAEIISNDNTIMEVNSYYYWNSNVLGMFDARYPNRIYINTRSLPRSIASIVGTNWHEAIHKLDSLYKDLYFHHGNNRFATWKNDTAPYYTGNIAFDISNGNPAEWDATEANDIVTYVPWYKRLFRWFF